MLTPDKEASGRDTPIPAPYLTTAWVDWQQAAGSILQGILVILHPCARHLLCGKRRTEQGWISPGWVKATGCDSMRAISIGLQPLCIYPHRPGYSPLARW